MLDAANVKIGGLNKTKDKLTSEIRELTIEIDNLSGMYTELVYISCIVLCANKE